MELTWLPEDRRFIGTETEARKLKKPFEKRDVPVKKAELIAYLNTEQEERDQAIAAAFEEGRQAGLAEALGSSQEARQDAEAPIPESPPEIKAKKVVPTAQDRKSIVEQILDLNQEQLPQVLSAAIGRLGEVAGSKGWAVFGKSVYSWTPGSRSVEQGLGMLMLAAFNNFGMKADEKPRNITPDKTTGEK